MQYLMTGIELHPDKGFGITADAYVSGLKALRIGVNLNPELRILEQWSNNRYSRKTRSRKRLEHYYVNAISQTVLNGKQIFIAG